MKIAILTKPDNASPRILSDSLKMQLEKENVYVDLFRRISLLTRLVSFKKSGLSFHFWVKDKLVHLYKDARLIRKLKRFDAIIIAEASPNAFLKKLYNVERLKKIIKKPVLLYEVYYLGNAPTQIDFLKKNGDALEDRYAFHLSVSNVTEIKQPSSDSFYSIGLYAENWNLQPEVKAEIIAIIDFPQPENLHYRDIQVRALNTAGIRYISLEKNYTIEDIRNIYRQGSIYFMQSSEAFGLPILECLCCGCQIFSPFSSWPMSWRLDEEPLIHAPGKLPDCFTIYSDENDLIEKLNYFKKVYNPVCTPKKNFETLLDNYPSFYFGNKNELSRLLKNLMTLYNIKK